MDEIQKLMEDYAETNFYQIDGDDFTEEAPAEETEEDGFDGEWEDD